jgi:hypothetical protein
VNTNQRLAFSYATALQKLGMFSFVGTELEEILTSGGTVVK